MNPPLNFEVHFPLVDLITTAIVKYPSSDACNNVTCHMLRVSAGSFFVLYFDGKINERYR